MYIMNIVRTSTQTLFQRKGVGISELQEKEGTQRSTFHGMSESSDLIFIDCDRICHDVT